MDAGRFYFVKDEYFEKFDPNQVLMRNKRSETGVFVGRPSFMGFPDKDNARIFWMIPISSKVDKFKAIVERKAQRRADKERPPQECDTIRFGEVLGRGTVFLIQNMFPVTEEYILHKYLNNNVEVRIAQNAERDIIDRAQKVLRLHRHGVKLIYGDIETIYRQLSEELTVTST